MGGGGLRILRHKSWHVWNKDNQQKVHDAQAKEAQRKQTEKDQQIARDAEKRVELLRQRQNPSENNQKPSKRSPPSRSRSSHTASTAHEPLLSGEDIQHHLCDAEARRLAFKKEQEKAVQEGWGRLEREGDRLWERKADASSAQAEADREELMQRIRLEREKRQRRKRGLPTAAGLSGSVARDGELSAAVSGNRGYRGGSEHGIVSGERGDDEIRSLEGRERGVDKETREGRDGSEDSGHDRHRRDEHRDRDRDSRRDRDRDRDRGRERSRDRGRERVTDRDRERDRSRDSQRDRGHGSVDRDEKRHWASHESRHSESKRDGRDRDYRSHDDKKDKPDDKRDRIAALRAEREQREALERTRAAALQ